MSATSSDDGDSCLRSCAACAVALAGLAATGAVTPAGIAACAFPEPTATKVACLAFLIGLGASIYGSIDSCSACVACLNAEEVVPAPPPSSIPDRPRLTPPSQRRPGGPVPIWVDIGCRRSSATWSECSRCCYRKYSAGVDGCLRTWTDEIAACDGWYWWPRRRSRAQRCYDKANAKMESCFTGAEYNYSDCMVICDQEFPRLPGVPLEPVPDFIPRPAPVRVGHASAG